VAADEAEAPALSELRSRLAEEEAAYAEVLAALDALASFALPAEAAPEARATLRRLNELWQQPSPPSGSGLRARLGRLAWEALTPFREQQTAFNAALVQLLNARLDEADRLHARLRELFAALVRYAQRVEPLVDARARVATALATTRSELVLDAFSRQLESHGRRMESLQGLAARVERLAGETKRR